MRNHTAIMAIILVAALTLALSAAVFGQATDRKISLDLKDAPIRQALQQVFMGSGLSYSIDAEVPADRRVELHLRDVDLESALQVLVRSAGLTYRKEGETYMITVKASAPMDTVSQPMTSIADPGIVEAAPVVQRIEKIPLVFADALDIASFLGVEATQSRGSMLSGGGGGMGGMGMGMSGGGYGGMGGMSGGFSGGLSGGGMSNFGNRGSSSFGTGGMSSGISGMRSF